MKHAYACTHRLGNRARSRRFRVFPRGFRVSCKGMGVPQAPRRSPRIGVLVSRCGVAWLWTQSREGGRRRKIFVHPSTDPSFFRSCCLLLFYNILPSKHVFSVHFLMPLWPLKLTGGRGRPFATAGAAVFLLRSSKAW